MNRDGSAQWIASFVDDLAAIPSGPGFTNFYAGGDAPSVIRRHNLSLYLHDTFFHDPRVMLVGEAPGYRGTRVTGVPFADARAVVEGVPRLSMLGLARGYRAPTCEDQPRTEQTSTIMWEALASRRFVPLLWAAFPFHPYRDREDSNRAPTSSELQLGGEFLARLIEDWEIEQVIAVGRIAERTLAGMGIDAERIRHPARGGKHEFNLGLDRYVNDAGLYQLRNA